MNGDINTIGIPSQLQKAMPRLPSLVTDAGERATLRFLEFFTAAIRNKNTRRAYARAVTRLSDWCQKRQLTLDTLHPIVIGGYIEQLQTELSPPSVKQHLAAIRMLFDFLVVGQILPMNPASSVRGPKHSAQKGKTPVLTAAETRDLLESIETDTLVGLRDRALIGVMVFSFARIGATLDMDVEDYFLQGKHWWFRLHEKGGKRHEVVAHHNAEELMDAYLDAAGVRGDKHGPIFRSFSRRRQLTERRLQPQEKEWYTPAEVATLLGKAEWTVRAWCRDERVNAEKRAGGRGRTLEWIISREEIVRIRNHGLLPLRRYRFGR